MGNLKFLLSIVAICVQTSHSRLLDETRNKWNDENENHAPVRYALVPDASNCAANLSTFLAKPFEPIRISYFLTKSANALPPTSVVFLTRALNTTTDFFQKLLEVRRTTSPIGFSDSNGCAGLVDFPSHIRDPKDACNPNAPGGVPDADFIVYVSADHVHSCADSSGTLAYASYCGLNAIDRRPVAGYVNVCPKEFIAQGWNFNATVSTLQHELMHALVFSGGLFNNFFDGSSTPATTTKTIERRWKINSQRNHVYNATFITSPGVQKFVRDHFKCPALEGAELENEGSGGTQGSHWEKRLFGPEVMTGSISRRSYFSHLTLHLLNDSGWYIANVSMAHTLSYGEGKGCEFAMMSCRQYMDYMESIGKNNSQDADPFCNWADYVERRKYSSTVRKCSGDREYISFCSWGTAMNVSQEYFKDKTAYLPKIGEFDGAGVAGGDGLTDGCPVWSDAYYGAAQSHSIRHGDSVCTNNESQPIAANNMGAEIYGSNSKCFEQDGKFEVYACKQFGLGEMQFEMAHGAGCYEYRCRMGRLFIKANCTDASWKTCWSKGSIISLRCRQHSGENYVDRFHKGDLICPSCTKLCEGNPRFPNFKCEEEARIDTGDFFVNPCRGHRMTLYGSKLIIAGIFISVFKVSRIFTLGACIVQASPAFASPIEFHCDWCTRLLVGLVALVLGVGLSNSMEIGTRNNVIACVSNWIPSLGALITQG